YCTVGFIRAFLFTSICNRHLPSHNACLCRINYQLRANMSQFTIDIQLQCAIRMQCVVSPYFPLYIRPSSHYGSPLVSNSDDSELSMFALNFKLLSVRMPLNTFSIFVLNAKGFGNGQMAHMIVCAHQLYI
ncbi:hypothetical protein BLOT_012987, partial [Blomia tropicalis]